MALVPAPGHFDGDGCTFPAPGHLVDEAAEPLRVPSQRVDEAPAATSLAAGAIGRGLVDAAAAYRAQLSTLLDPAPSVQLCTDAATPIAVAPEVSTAVNPAP